MNTHYRRTTGLIMFCLLVTAVCLVGQAEDAKPTTAPPSLDEASKRNRLAHLEGKLQVRRGRQNPPPATAAAMKELFATKTYEELIVIPEQWRSQFPRAEFQILVRELLKKMESRRVLAFTKPDFVLVAPYYTTAELGNSVKAFREGKPSAVYLQDLYIEGGRCAFVLGELFNMTNTILPIWQIMSDEHLAYAVRENTFIILEAMAIPDEIDFAAMNAQERERLAGKTRHYEILRKLQKDTDRRVRLAMARRVELGLIEEGLLQHFEQDPDPEVRAAGVLSWKTYLHKHRGFQAP